MTEFHKDYYEILGVPPSASSQDIRRAYRKLAREWHPDNNKSPDATGRMQEIIEARAVLGDPSKRAGYDRSHRPLYPSPKASASLISPIVIREVAAIIGGVFTLYAVVSISLTVLHSLTSTTGWSVPVATQPSPYADVATNNCCNFSDHYRRD